MSQISFQKKQYGVGVNGEVLDRSAGKLQLRVTVDDGKLREATRVPHDGYEKAFALMPMQDGSWKRFDLPFESHNYNRMTPPSGNHVLTIDALANGVSLDRVHAEGVAFGIDISGANNTDQTTVWLQYRDDNYKPND